MFVEFWINLLVKRGLERRDRATVLLAVLIDMVTCLATTALIVCLYFVLVHPHWRAIGRALDISNHPHGEQP
jgi:hypothetical protein